MADNRNFAALDWVIGEIDETLKQARQSLEAYVDNPQDSTRIRFCLTHIHQVHGSLQMVEFYGAALLAEEMEAIAQALMNGEVSNPAEAYEVLMRAILQLPIYLDQVRARRNDDPGSLLPILNDLRAARGSTLLSESQFFNPDISAARIVRGKRNAAQANPAQFKEIVAKLRKMYQYAAAGVIRGVKIDENLDYLQKTFARLYTLTSGTGRQCLWDIALGVVEGLNNENLDISVSLKTLLRQLDKEIRLLSEYGVRALNSFTRDELIKNLLYYVARSEGTSPRIERLRKEFALDTALPAKLPVNADTPLFAGPDPETMRTVVAALQDELGTIKEALDESLSGQDDAILHNALPVMKRVADTLAVLGVVDLRKQMLAQIERLDMALAERQVGPQLLTEVADEIMVVEESLALLANASSHAGGPQSTRQMHINEAQETVLREARNGLEQAKDAIIEYIASQWERSHLASVPQQLDEIRGGLAMIPLPRPAAILRGCARYIEAELLSKDETPDWSALDTLADAIASVEYFLERLSGDREDDDDALLTLAEESIRALGYGVPGTARATDRPTRAGSDDRISAQPLTDAVAADTDQAQDAATAEIAAPVYASAADAEHEEVAVETEPAARAEQVAAVGIHDPVAETHATEVAEEQPVAAVHEEAVDEDAQVAAGPAAEYADAEEASKDVPELSPETEDFSAVVEEPSAVVEEPSAVMEEPSAVMEEPSAVMEEPSAIAREPSAVVEEPSAVVEEPSAMVEEPSAETDDPRAEAFIAESSADASAPQSLSEDRAVISDDETDQAIIAASASDLASPVAAVTAAEHAADDDEEAVDEEILEIFIEEAGEVLEAIDEFFPQWAADFDDTEALTEFRRAFHTLKGSGRMVGANDIGELAWSIENMLNRVLDGTVAAHPVQVELITRVRALLPEFIQAFEHKQPNPQPQLAAQLMSWAEAVSRGATPEALCDGAAAAAEPPLSQADAVVAAAEDEEDSAESNAILWEIFGSEAITHLQVVEDFVIEMKASAPLFTPPSETMQRALHTLKGSAHMADVHDVAALATPLERFAKELRTYQVNIDQDILQLFEDGVIYTRDALDQIRGGGIARIARLGQFLARVAELRDLFVVPLIRQQEQREEKVIDPKLLSIFMAEEMDLLLDADVIIARWQEAPEEPEKLDRLITELNTLAKGAEHAHLPPMARVSRQLAAIYSTSGGVLTALAAEDFATLLAAHEQLLDMVDAVAAGQNLKEADTALDVQLQLLQQKLELLAPEPAAAAVVAEVAVSEPSHSDAAGNDDVADQDADTPDVADRVITEQVVAEQTVTEHIVTEKRAAGHEGADAEAAELPDDTTGGLDSDVAEQFIAAIAELGDAQTAAAAEAVAAETGEDLPDRADIPLLGEVVELAALTPSAYALPDATGTDTGEFAEAEVTARAGNEPADLGVGETAPDAPAAEDTPDRVAAEAVTDVIDMAEVAELAAVDEFVELEIAAAEQALAATDTADEIFDLAVAELDADEPAPAEPPVNSATLPDTEILPDTEALTDGEPWVVGEPLDATVAVAETVELDLPADVAAEALTELDEVTAEEMELAAEPEPEPEPEPGAEAIGLDADETAAEAPAEAAAAEFEDAAVLDGAAVSEDETLAVEVELEALELAAVPDETAELPAGTETDGPAAVAEFELAAVGEAGEQSEAAAPVATELATNTSTAVTDFVLPRPLVTTSQADDDADDIDPEIIEIFLEEADELMEDIEQAVHDWSEDWERGDCSEQLQRALHTLKGGARLSGMTALGNVAHDFETVVINLTTPDANFFATINGYQDQLLRGIAAVKAGMSGETGLDEALTAELAGVAVVNATAETGAVAEEAAADCQLDTAESAFADEAAPDVGGDAPEQSEDFASAALVTGNFASGSFDADENTAGSDADYSFIPAPTAAAGAGQVVPFRPNDGVPVVTGASYELPPSRSVSRMGGGSVSTPMQVKRSAPQEVVKVSAELLEELVNLAGETSINRGRMEEQISELGFAIEEMDATISRLQEQLRRLDIETEAQILFRQEQMAELEDFDPLEMDRYSQLQQLSRSLIESASDLMDLKATLADKTRDTETLLLQQARINTDLQEGLMRSRMVPFSRLVPRLRRIVRQVAGELDKRVSFELDNVEGELDRTVLERMMAPLEHMLRNAVDHGIESPRERVAAGKSEAGRIVLTVGREGGDVILRLIDDGRGINLKRVREKAIERGLMSAEARLSDREVMQFILHAGFSTAESVTQISGRGVGMDVVHSEIKQLGGAVLINSREGEGTEFVIRLPFTVSVNRALMVRIGDDRYAIPLNTIEGIVRVSPFELEHYYQNPEARFEYAGEQYKVHYLGTMLSSDARPKLEGQAMPLPVVLVRSAQQAVAMQVDMLMGSREVVVKSLGPQFSAVAGVSGATVMGDGSVVVILDPHAMIRQSAALAHDMTTLLAPAETEPQTQARTVMVVDDSVTVRKVTSRFLEREGYEVMTAKDGADAMQQLQDRIPDVMLLDIEMPRMDGFEVAKNVRSSSRLKQIPIIMITSRTGDKHRERAFSLGVDRYMGKPYQEDKLLHNIRVVTGELVDTDSQAELADTLPQE